MYFLLPRSLSEVDKTQQSTVICGTLCSSRCPWSVSSWRPSWFVFLFQHHDGAAVREGEGRGRLFIRGLQRGEHLWFLSQEAMTVTGLTCDAARPHWHPATSNHHQQSNQTPPPPPHPPNFTPGDTQGKPQRDSVTWTQQKDGLTAFSWLDEKKKHTQSVCLFWPMLHQFFIAP